MKMRKLSSYFLLCILVFLFGMLVILFFLHKEHSQDSGIGSRHFVPFEERIKHLSNKELQVLSRVKKMVKISERKQHDQVYIQKPRLKKSKPEMDKMYGRRNESSRPEVFLSAVLLVRIYDSDPAKLTITELKQWLSYMLFSGVERIYLYDNYNDSSESLRKLCERNYKKVIVYHDWSEHQPYSVSKTQIRAYTHAVDNYKDKTKWMMFFDMDEFPFVKNDEKIGFLKRYIQFKSDAFPDVSEFSIKAFLFLGQPRHENLFLKRYYRRQPRPSTDMDKPIVLASDVRFVNIHHNGLKRGKSMDVSVNEIQLNHYWGGRLQNWGPDTQAIIRKTIYDDSIEGLADRLEKLDKLDYY